MTLEPKLLRIEDAAAALGIGRSKLYQLLAADLLPVVKIGRRALIPTHAIEEFAERLEAEQGAGGGA
ncbi:MAG: helix-turn-helix domain-containing protein [Dehalococcoidia bacterium]